MKNKTVKVIVILVGLLFINIEAAHAGLIQKFKIYIGHGFPGYSLIYIVCATLSVALLSYIILAPAFKEKGKFAGNSYYSQQTYQNKKNRVKKISEILKSPQSPN